MQHIPDALIDQLIAEDARYGDLSTHLLGVEQAPARARILCRQRAVVSGASEAARLFTRLGARVEALAEEGAWTEPGGQMLLASGPAGALHAAWKVSINLLEFCCGIATRTRTLVDLARSAHPQAVVATTRKTIPGTRDLSVKAARAGGALPHRLGLSETVLFFSQHHALCGGFQALLASIPAMQARCPEHKVLVEVEDLAGAYQALAAGVDGVQCDKMPAADIARVVAAASARLPRPVVIASGGINASNIVEYARTRVPVIATSSVYYGPPADFSFSLEGLAE